MNYARAVAESFVFTTKRVIAATKPKINTARALEMLWRENWKDWEMRWYLE